MRPLLGSEPELASDFQVWHVCPGSYICAPALGMQVDFQTREQVGECPLREKVEIRGGNLFSEVNDHATTFDTIDRFVMPEASNSLVPDNEDDVE